MQKKIRHYLIRVCLTLIYCGFGLVIAFPLSYFFQGPLFEFVSFRQYLNNGMQLIVSNAQFGSLDVYRYTTYSAVIGCVVLGRLIEWLISKVKMRS